MKSETTLKSGGHTRPWWLLFTFDNPIRKLVHHPEKVLAPYVKPGDTVLDVGCGMGYFTLGLAPGYIITAILFKSKKSTPLSIVNSIRSCAHERTCRIIFS